MKKIKLSRCLGVITSTAVAIAMCNCGATLYSYAMENSISDINTVSENSIVNRESWTKKVDIIGDSGYVYGSTKVSFTVIVYADKSVDVTCQIGQVFDLWPRRTADLGNLWFNDTYYNADINFIGEYGGLKTLSIYDPLRAGYSIYNGYTGDSSSDRYRNVGDYFSFKLTPKENFEQSTKIDIFDHEITIDGTANSKYNFDVNGDGKVNVVDLALLKQYILGE